MHPRAGKCACQPPASSPPSKLPGEGTGFPGAPRTFMTHPPNNGWPTIGWDFSVIMPAPAWNGKKACFPSGTPSPLSATRPKTVRLWMTCGPGCPNRRTLGLSIIRFLANLGISGTGSKDAFPSRPKKPWSKPCRPRRKKAREVNDTGFDFYQALPLSRLSWTRAVTRVE